MGDDWKPPADAPVYIVCAAVRMKSGLIVASARHLDSGMHKLFDALKTNHAQIAEQGFIDQWGRFYSRAQAWDIAKAQGQIRKEVSSEGTLYSENLY